MLVNPLENNAPFTAISLDYIMPKFFDKIWVKSRTKICVDSSANRVHDFFKQKRIRPISPDFVVGSLENIKSEVKTCFRRSRFVKDSDNQVSDVDKAIKLAVRESKDPIILLGAFGGRFDHSANNIFAPLRFRNSRIWMIDDNNLGTWIFPDDEGIRTPMKFTTDVCGVLPIYRPAIVSSKGLLWDMDKLNMNIGDFISSSNSIKAKQVKLKTDVPVFWMNQMKKNTSFMYV